MKRLHHQSDAVAIWVKETKRQGRIAHHHADATVPHIVALLGFSFHAANIGIFRLSSKYFSNKSAFSLAKCRWLRFFLVNHSCCKRMFLHRKMLGRRYLGIEQEEVFAAISKARCEEIENPKTFAAFKR